ncbi:hypothetical protein [Vagococcus carniphilus]|uniref:hypothetical protein n=1 Tax=Vagococcus carniphilus TaxID=218144 RepID=UPI0028916A72|nr:hypothetical protein [Vagococcus carniphilus]MDT2813834.1 hypothetical protein [Vagococcus carniphilus]MDT2865512.1 hypothetical protein [Vagococcus carniphilus]
MFNSLKTNFIQATLGGTVWVTFLANLVFQKELIPFNYTWHLLAIGGLIGITFGIIYPYLWNYSTFSARLNIFLSTLINTLCGFAGVYLFSVEMFDFIKLFLIPIFVITLIGHIIGFYFYSNYQNKKQVKKLNQLIS